MPFSFTAVIYKNGINLCVDVPLHITNAITGKKGFIKIRGTLRKHFFQQTLVPVANAPYRLFVNGIMLKGAAVGEGDRVRFTIEPDEAPPEYPIPAALLLQLKRHKLLQAFESLTPSRQKEINRYIGALKTGTVIEKNISKVITSLKMKT
ncbi:MAG: DUF1905 domain-containing protein [Bacteroidetes bacterium]|nr:DUF1905 domain-containing protein [Bacteroidota bacterium]